MKDGSFARRFGLAVSLTAWFGAVGCSDGDRPVGYDQWTPSNTGHGGQGAQGASGSGGGGPVGGSAAATPSHVWSKGFGDEGNLGAQYAYDVAVDGSGNVVVAGHATDGVADLGNGDIDSSGFVGQLTADGALVWDSPLGGLGAAVGVLGSGSVVAAWGDEAHWMDPATGDSTGSVPIALGVDGEARDITFDGQDNVIVAGSFDSQAVDLGCTDPISTAGEEDIYVVKLDASRNCVWLKAFGSAATQLPYGVSTRSTGSEIVVVGGFEGELSFGGSCSTLSTNEAVYDIFVAQLDASGNCVWARQFGADEAAEWATAVALDPVSGNAIVGGVFSGTVSFDASQAAAHGATDVFVAELAAADGTVGWAHAVGGDSFDDTFGCLDVDSSGNIAVAGRFVNILQHDAVDLFASDSASNLFLLSWDPAGTLTGAGYFPGQDLADCHGLAFPGPDVLLTGEFKGSINFGGPDDELTAASVDDRDAFLAKLSFE